LGLLHRELIHAIRKVDEILKVGLTGERDYGIWGISSNLCHTLDISGNVLDETQEALDGCVH